MLPPSISLDIPGGNQPFKPRTHNHHNISYHHSAYNGVHLEISLSSIPIPPLISSSRIGVSSNYYTIIDGCIKSISRSNISSCHKKFLSSPALGIGTGAIFATCSNMGTFGYVHKALGTRMDRILGQGAGEQFVGGA